MKQIVEDTLDKKKIQILLAYYGVATEIMDTSPDASFSFNITDIQKWVKGSHTTIDRKIRELADAGLMGQELSWGFAGGRSVWLTQKGFKICEKLEEIQEILDEHIEDDIPGDIDTCN